MKLTTHYACWSNCMLMIRTCKSYWCCKNMGVAGSLQDMHFYLSLVNARVRYYLSINFCCQDFINTWKTSSKIHLTTTDFRWFQASTGMNFTAALPLWQSYRINKHAREMVTGNLVLLIKRQNGIHSWL